jgi:hypothetical protein
VYIRGETREHLLQQEVINTRLYGVRSLTGEMIKAVINQRSVRMVKANRWNGSPSDYRQLLSDSC